MTDAGDSSLQECPQLRVLFMAADIVYGQDNVPVGNFGLHGLITQRAQLFRQNAGQKRHVGAYPVGHTIRCFPGYCVPLNAVSPVRRNGPPRFLDPLLTQTGRQHRGHGRFQCLGQRIFNGLFPCPRKILPFYDTGPFNIHHKSIRKSGRPDGTHRKKRSRHNQRHHKKRADYLKETFFFRHWMLNGFPPPHVRSLTL